MGLADLYVHSIQGLPDLAFALAENSVLINSAYKFELATKSLSFTKAFNLLYKTYQDSPGNLFFPLPL